MGNYSLIWSGLMHFIPTTEIFQFNQMAEHTNYQKDAESSWGEPERVANCIWNAHTDMQLFVQPNYYGYTGMG